MDHSLRTRGEELEASGGQHVGVCVVGAELLDPAHRYRYRPEAPRPRGSAPTHTWLLQPDRFLIYFFFCINDFNGNPLSLSLQSCLPLVLDLDPVLDLVWVPVPVLDPVPVLVPEPPRASCSGPSAARAPPSWTRSAFTSVTWT